MGISVMRSGRFARPVFIAIAIIVAAAGGAHATCSESMAAFESAVKSGSKDQVVQSFDNLLDDPSCPSRANEEARAEMVDFLIAYASKPENPASACDDAIGIAERILQVFQYWRGRTSLGDYYFARRDWPHAYFWYLRSIYNLDTADVRPAEKERRGLIVKLTAATLLADDDPPANTGSISPVLGCRCISDDTPPLLKVFVQGVLTPLPVKFGAGRNAILPIRDDWMMGLAELIKPTTSTVTLIGHAGRRGYSHRHAMNLSQRRVIAVRDELTRRYRVATHINIDWKGDLEPFDLSILPNAGQLNRKDIQKLDDRIEIILSP